jgi:hypothetical protein
MDYGKFKVFPDPRVTVLGFNYAISNYRLGCGNRGVGSKMALADKSLSIQGDGLEIEITLH